MLQDVSLHMCDVLNSSLQQSPRSLRIFLTLIRCSLPWRVLYGDLLPFFLLRLFYPDAVPKADIFRCPELALLLGLSQTCPLSQFLFLLIDSKLIEGHEDISRLL